MELWKMIFHPLLRVRVNRNRSTWNAISKVLRTTSDASFYNSDTSNHTSHPSKRHHRLQKRHHHPSEANPSQFPSSRGLITARRRTYQFNGWLWRENTTHLPFINKTKTHSHICSAPSSSSYTSDSSSRMPAAAKKPTMKTVFGRQWVDEYAWMQQGFSEEFLQYIKAENNFSEQYFNHLKAIQEKLRAEIIQCEEGDYGSETKLKVIGDYAYYPDISESGSNIFCRRNIRTCEDQVLLDSNHLIKVFGYNQFIITGFKISPCQQYLGAVVEGSPDVYDGHIFKMEVGGQCRLVECIQDISNMEFLGDDSVLYTKPFDLQAREVWRHRIGSSQERDELVFEEIDERFFVDLSHTKDRRYVVINSNSRTSSELWLIDCLRGSSGTQPLLVWPRQDGVECYLDNCGRTLLALSNAGDSSELKLFKAQPPDDIQSSHTDQWKELYSPPPGHVIQDMDVFASHCVLALQVDNIPQLAIVQHSGEKEPLHIELPPEHTTILPGLNADINSRHYQFQLSSPVHPPKNFELDLQTCNIEVGESDEDTGSEDERQEVHSTRARSRRQPEDFACQRLVAQSQDGTKVPITVFHRENLVLDGQHPMLVIGYGAYGRNVEMEYMAERMALLSNGWVLAFCHVRGGGELGKEWYYSGKGDQKHHSFEDLESCLEFLHSSGFSRPALTAGWAASAGALLLGVLCNRRPQLLRAAVMRMPFVDILSSMLDSSSPLTSQDIEEWGDPSGSAAEMEYISAYCPYQNLRSQSYPSILVTSSMGDQRVPAWVPAKYMARLRDRTRDHDHEHNCSTFLLRVHPDGGHFGPDEGDGGVDQATMECAFLHQELSLNTLS